MSNYFTYLLQGDFTLLYFGRWKDALLVEAKAHEDVIVLNEDSLDDLLTQIEPKSTIVITTDEDRKGLRYDKNQILLYKQLKESDCKAIILGDCVSTIRKKHKSRLTAF